MADAGPTRRCRRCATQEAVVQIRTDFVCSDCYCRFIATKTVKRLEVLNRDTTGASYRPKSASAASVSASAGPRGSLSKVFHVGLSFGPSSASLVHVCEQIISDRLARGRDAAFSLHVVHVDTNLSPDDADDRGRALPSGVLSTGHVDQLLDRWRQRFPRFTFERVPLAEALELTSIDWSLLCPQQGDDTTCPSPHPQTRLRGFLDGLPSASSRRDMLDLLVRRLLIARAAAAHSYALLLGCSTTALAERALAATAKGRGYSLPWQLEDGLTAEPTTPASSTPSTPSSSSSAGSPLLLYYPLRELFRKELVVYTGLVQQPPLTDILFPPPPPPPSPSDTTRGPRATGATSMTSMAGATAAVVSHRDLSIEDVMARYFAEVEENYPSIVANVVKTATKLERQGDVAGLETEADGEQGSTEDSSCRACGMPLDDIGNERWKGEIGERNTAEDGPAGPARRLCYGCERSLHG